MTKSEIKSEIRWLKNAILELENDRNAYLNMNSKIKEAIVELEKAESQIQKSSELLGLYYNSNTSKEKVLELEEEKKEVSKIITKLESEILEASYDKINSMNLDIRYKKSRIEKLNRELDRIDKEGE